MGNGGRGVASVVINRTPRVYLTHLLGRALAQEVRVVVCQQEGCWFDPRAPPR